MTRVIAAVTTVALGALLVGCASTSSETFAKRFLLEYQSASGLSDSSIDALQKFADGLAADAGQYCGEEAYSAAFTDEPALFYAWEVTCFMYYEDRFSEAHADQVRAMILEQTLDAAPPTN